MPAIPSRAARLALATAVLAAAAGCSSFNNASQSIAGLVTPYRIEVVQGNFVSKEQVEALKPGMSRAQVRDIMGSPLVASVFHADRWDYVFTLVRPGVADQRRALTVFFKGDAFDRVEGDTMPTEAEFVATMDNKRKGITPPPLVATEEQMQRYETGRAASAARSASAPVATPAPAATAYPPLEPAAR